MADVDFENLHCRRRQAFQCFHFLNCLSQIFAVQYFDHQISTYHLIIHNFSIILWKGDNGDDVFACAFVHLVTVSSCDCVTMSPCKITMSPCHPKCLLFFFQDSCAHTSQGEASPDTFGDHHYYSDDEDGEDDKDDEDDEDDDE